LFLTLFVVDILGLFVVPCPEVFPAGQSTNRKYIAEIPAESIKTLTNGACIRSNIRASSSLDGTHANLVRQITAKHLRQIAP
jgi:hypothetical protein